MTTRRSLLVSAAAGLGLGPTGEESIFKLGPLPFGECYFAGAGHPGISPDEGELLILHVPTGDVWSLSPVDGGRNLYLQKLYDGAAVQPPEVEPAVQNLKAHAHLLCGGLSPARTDTGIETCNYIFGVLELEESS